MGSKSKKQKSKKVKARKRSVKKRIEKRVKAKSQKLLEKEEVDALLKGLKTEVQSEVAPLEVAEEENDLGDFSQGEPSKVIPLKKKK